jgi:hypothetical protein
MNEWGFIGQQTLVELRLSTTINQFKRAVWLGADGKLNVF